MLLHGPDEYLAFPARPTRRALWLRDTLDAMETYKRSAAPSLWVYQIPLAHESGFGADAAISSSVLSASNVESTVEAVDLDRTSLLMNPDTCMTASAEFCSCSARGQEKRSEGVPRIEPRRLVALHFMELLPRDHGRCSILFGQRCWRYHDAWARLTPYVKLLRNRTPGLPT
mmetsp:Transcript_64621/g.187240  ORF Transcript_64621/g.187240 Transcript_64621/m.187240 type:complete len:172 (+) Transcript_64621:1-516(+)